LYAGKRSCIHVMSVRLIAGPRVAFSNATISHTIDTVSI
jgi:hypothetical protein